MSDWKKKIYDKTPAFMQDFACGIQGRLIIKERYNAQFYKDKAELTNSQWRGKDQIERYQEEHLHKIIEYAYNNTDFYHNFFQNHHVTPQDFKELDDIRKFPVLTKEMIRENYNKMVSRTIAPSLLVKSHTSGSSGKALDFYLTKDSIPFQWAVWWRFRERFGVQMGDKHLNCTGKLVVPIGVKRPPYWRINRPLNQWLINMQHISSAKIAAIVEMINKERFVYFSGYPSIIFALASCIKENGLKVTAPPRFIFTGAEKLYDNQRTVIEEVFENVVCTDHYGMSEGACNASKCRLGHYHEDFEFGLLECEEKHWISNTEYEGEILGTSFVNFGMPLIRYKIGDTAIWDTTLCS